MKIFVFVNLILTSYLECNEFDILYGRLDSIDILKSSEVDVCFENAKTDKKILCKVITYESLFQCDLCKQKVKVLLTKKDNNEYFICRCINCCNHIQNFNIFYIKLNSNFFDLLPSVCVTGKIDELYEFNNLIFNLTFSNEKSFFYKSGKITELNGLKKKKLFFIKSSDVSNIKKIFVFSDKFKKSDFEDNKSGCKIGDINSVYYRFNNSYIRNKKNTYYHYVGVKGFKIEYDKTLVLKLSSIIRKLWKHQYSYLRYNGNKINKNSTASLSLKFNIYYNVSDDKLVKDMADVVLKTYLLIYIKKLKLKYPTFDPFDGFREYESFVTYGKLYKNFILWLLSKSSTFSVIYSCDKTLESVNVFEEIKAKLCSKEIDEVIRKECRNVELLSYFNKISNRTLLFIMHFERIIFYDEQKIILLYILNYFNDYKVDFNFSIVNDIQMYGIFNICNYDRDFLEKFIFINYILKYFQNFGLTKIRLDYKKNNYSYQNNIFSNFETFLELIIKQNDIYEDNKQKEKLSGKIVTKNSNIHETYYLLKSSADQSNLSEEHGSLQRYQQYNYNDIRQKAAQNEQLEMFIEFENEVYNYEECLKNLMPMKIEGESYDNRKNLFESTSSDRPPCSSSLVELTRLEYSSGIHSMNMEFDIPDEDKTNVAFAFNIIKKCNDSNTEDNK